MTAGTENELLARFTRRAGPVPPGVSFADDGDVILIHVAPEHSPLDLKYMTRLDGEARSLGLRGAVLGNY